MYGENKHAEVTLLLNCDSRELDARADTHLVLVHVRRCNGDGFEDRFAEWLAEQIGQKVIGPLSTHEARGGEEEPEAG